MPTTTPPKAATTPDLARLTLLLAATTVLTSTARPTPLNPLPQEVPERRPAETAIFSSAGHPDGRVSEDRPPRDRHVLAARPIRLR